MSALTWDEIGERLFETGVSKGVLYKSDGFGVVWNGLTSVDENVSNSSEPVYFDGIKFHDIIRPGDFSGLIRAFTYPIEFLEYEGTLEDETGFYLLNQPSQRFGLSYQTKIGDDITGLESGYKIHILYNLSAQPSTKSYKTLGETLDPIEFEWDLTSIPEEIEGFRPTAHVILDSRRIDPYLLKDIETIIYGDTEGTLKITDNGDGTWTAETEDEGVIIVDEEDGSFEIITDTAEYIDEDTYMIWSSANDAYLPSLSSLISYVRSWQRLVITDHGDGSWTAYSKVPGVITMLDDTTFVITSDTAEYIDADTYTISSSDKTDNDIWLPPIPPLP